MTPRSRSIASAALLILGLFFILAAVSVWVTGPHHWKVLGLAVSLSEWRKPWWIGSGLIVAAGLIAEGPLPPWRWLGVLGRRLDHLFRPASAGPPTAATLWENWGAAIGAGIGFFFALHYYYLVPPLAIRVAVVIIAAAAGAILHRQILLALDAGMARMSSRLTEAPRARIIASLYFLLWAALIAGPLRRWEARFTEPVFTQGLFALAVGMAGLAIWRKSRRGLWWWHNRKWRRRVLVAAAVGVVFWLGYAVWWGSIKQVLGYPQKRVILITLDTTRADHLSCYGYSRKTTPNLDRLAEHGIRFTRAFAPMAATDPSHLSILTGWYPRTHGVRVPMSGHMPVSPPSLAETFLDHGFDTAAITSRIMLDPWRLGLTGFNYVSVPTTQDTSAAEAYRRAMNWLVHNNNRKVFLWVHFFDPHQPYVRHPGFTEKFGPAPDPSIAGDKWLDPGKSYTPAEIQERIDYYDGEIAYMDYYIGRLLDGIGNLGPALQPALVVVMGDHGEMLGEKLAPPAAYGFGHGGVIYDEATRIPWIMVGERVQPDFGKNTRHNGFVRQNKPIDAVAETVDLAPTITELLWKELYKCQGHSLVPTLADDAEKSNNLAFIQRDQTLGELPRPFLAKDQYAVVQWPWKLFYTIDGDLELYDLAADPVENHNLALEQPDQVDRLKNEWDRWAQITPETPSESHHLTASELQNLKNLGYIQ
jgi:arylsulfatase